MGDEVYLIEDIAEKTEIMRLDYKMIGQKTWRYLLLLLNHLCVYVRNSDCHRSNNKND